MPFGKKGEFSVRVTKIIQGLVSHGLAAYLFDFYLFFNSVKWPYYQKHKNQMFLSHTAP